MAFIVISIFNLYIHKIRFKALGAIFLVFGAFLLRLCIDINNLPGPDNLLDFGFMRDQTYIYQAYAIVSQGDFTISYHVPGFLSLIGLSFILIDNNFRLTKSTIFLIFFSFLIIFYTGARQNLLGFFVLLIYFITTFTRKNFFIRLRLYSVYIFIIFFVLLEVSPILSSATMDSTIEATGRQIHYLKGLGYFNENPLNGIGIGFHDYGGKATYPHNLFIELLAEVGIIGVLLTLLSTIYSIVKNNRNKKINSKYIILIIPFFIRAMISGSLTTNVIFFSLLFSIHFLPSFRSKQSKI